MIKSHKIEECINMLLNFIIERVGSRLPNFTAEQSADLMASCDYFGLNHYTSWYTANGADPCMRERERGREGDERGEGEKK